MNMCACASVYEKTEKYLFAQFTAILPLFSFLFTPFFCLLDYVGDRLCITKHLNGIVRLGPTLATAIFNGKTAESYAFALFPFQPVHGKERVGGYCEQVLQDFLMLLG